MLTSSVNLPKVIYFYLIIFIVPSFISAQTPNYIDLKIQLERDGSPPIRDNKLTLNVSILESNGRAIFTEDHQSVWTNYDGFIDIDLGTVNSADWHKINWNSGTKKVRVVGRAFGAPASRNEELYKGDLPVVAYSQNALNYTNTKNGVGRLSLFQSSNHPNIELHSESISNYPFIDFASSDIDNDYVARIRLDDNNEGALRFQNRRNRFNFFGNNSTNFVQLYTDERYSAIKLFGYPYIDFHKSRDPGSPEARIGMVGSNTLSFKSENGSGFSFEGGPLRVNGSIQYLSRYYGLYLHPSDGGVGANQSNAPVSIYAENRVAADGFMARSDIRIKKIVIVPDPLDDIDRVRSLKTVDFQYKDELTSGNKIVRGFIAQEVQNILPHAVQLTKAVIPDIFQIGKNVSYDDETKWLFFSIDSIGDTKVGEKLRLIGKQEHLVEVTEIEGTRITVSGLPEEKTEEVFVYGREVNDLQLLDSDQIFALNVSATQGLIQEVDSLKSQIIRINTKNKELSGENQMLKNGIREINERLDNLTQLVNKIDNVSSNSIVGSN